MRIGIFNSLGQIVRMFELGQKEPGIHEIIFDAKDLTTGIYIYRIDAGYASTAGKMLYMK